MTQANQAPVYFVISYDIVDMAMFEQYPPKVLEILSRHGAELLASDTEAVAIEGVRKMMHSIIRFPSEQAALAAFNSPEYQEGAKPYRIGSTTNTTVILVHGLVPEVQ